MGANKNLLNVEILLKQHRSELGICEPCRFDGLVNLTLQFSLKGLEQTTLYIFAWLSVLE